MSGAYWYENPGPQGGEWKRHQWRTVEIVGEFVSDCGEWTVAVNHDGPPDIVAVGWKPVILMIAETAFIAGIALVAIAAHWV